MQINIAKNSVDRMRIFFHMLLPRSCPSKWYQWLRIWLSRNIRFVGVNVGMSARNRHFQTNYWCITIWGSATLWATTEAQAEPEQLELERLRSEENANVLWIPSAASWLPTLLSHVGSQVKTRSNDFEDIGQGQRSPHATHLLVLVIICRNIERIHQEL